MNLNRLFINLAIAMLWLISFLPMNAIIAISKVLQTICYVLAKNKYSKFLTNKYHIARVNLRLCFPQKSQAQIEELLQENFTEAIISILHYGFVISRSETAIKHKVKSVNWSYVSSNYLKRPIILLTPHFWGLDIGASRNSIDFTAYSIMHDDDNSILRDKLKLARCRFMKNNGGKVFGRDEGISKVIRLLRRNKFCFYYLPDIDLGEHESIYLPFLGHNACATLTSLAKITNLTNAIVIPVIPIRKGNHYISICHEPWDNFPTGNIYNDTLRMSQFVEQVVLKYPTQYMWDLQRFGTQPDLIHGEIYQNHL